MHDVAIIGGGPSGIAASIYLKRAGFDTILFEKNQIGGLLLNAHLVENYPGFPEGIKGKDLCKHMENHLKKWKIKIINDEVEHVSFENESFRLKIKNKHINFKSIIMATGTNYNKLGIPGEKELTNKSVFYEIKDILSIIKPGDKCSIIGSGDAAFDYALNLAEEEVMVDIFFRSNKPKCIPILEKRVIKCKKIKTYPNHKPVNILKKGEKSIVDFKYTSNENNKVSKISDYILIACGRQPNETLLTDRLKQNNIPGFYIAGDVKADKYRQVGIAVGEGIFAAMNAETYLRGKN